MNHRTTQAPEQSSVTPASEIALEMVERNCAAISNIIDGHIAEIKSLRALVRRYRIAMDYVRDELEDDFDVNDGDDGPVPNKAMRLANEIDEAIYGPGGF